MTKITFLLFVFLGFFLRAQVVVYSTDFQGGIPADMTIINNDSNIPEAGVSEFSDAWICVADPENTIDSVAASTSYFSEPDTADRWLITPSLPLGPFGNLFTWNAKSQDASFPDDYFVLVSTTDNDPASFIDTIGYIEEENFEWTERSFNLSEGGYDNETIYIAFVLRTFDGFKLYIDDIELVKEDDTGIESKDLFKFILYPVPAKSFLNVRCDTPIEAITIHNLQGSLVHQGDETSINIESFPAGTYLLTLETSMGEATKLFLKR